MVHPLNPHQRAILEHAVRGSGGKVVWLPEHIKGGARIKVLQGLVKRALIAPDGDGWLVTAEGFRALSDPQPTPASAALEPPAPAVTAPVSPCDEEDSANLASRSKRTRPNSKQAMMITLLKRPEGATLHQIIEATNWQPHTVRGALAGALKKRLGLPVTSSKEPGGQRVYRIEAIEEQA